ncbi:MAG: F0F1 ATP synthase subunit A [Bacteroidia bacterium]|nr:F0F1 ATP synthase subunit A [Bacteroidia bacterium]
MIRKFNMFQRNFFPTLVFILCLFSANKSFSEDTIPKKPFNAGELILHHVQDAHSWHITGHTSVPLPMIVKTDKGIECFSSSVFWNKEHEPTEIYTSPSSGYDFFLNHEHLKVAKKENGEFVKGEEGYEEDEEATKAAKILDLSMTKNVFSLLFGALIMCWIFLSVAKMYKKRPGQGTKGLQSLIEPLIMFVRDDVAKPSIGKKSDKFLPFLLTVFFFIWINNLLGMIPFMPGGANLTGSVSITMVLALLTFVITMVNTNAHYWRHVFAMPGVPIGVLIILTPIEILGVFIKPFVLMVRLFANITAGHIIALAFFSLIFIFGEMSTGAAFGVSVVSVIFTVFMFFMELLVAFLQAYVFTLLSAMYFGGAVEEGHHAEAHHPETAAAH